MPKKRITIDARMVNASGIGTYIRGLLEGLRGLPSLEFDLTLLGDPTVLPQGPWQAQKARSSIYTLVEQAEIPRLAAKQKTGLLHSPHYNVPWLWRSRSVVTVHDLIHLKFPQFWPSPLARAYAQFYFHQIVPKAKAILTPSQNTKEDLMQIAGIPESRIAVTPLAVSLERSKTSETEQPNALQSLHLPEPYILYVGNLKEFKNVVRLVDAYQKWRQKRKDCPSLVLVGRNFIPGFDARLKATEGIRWIGEISHDVLPALYRSALFFIFPSLYEGFGLPPLEAMASGTPVICSNRASLPEVVGDAALMVNPEDMEEIMAAMDRLLDSSALRTELSAKGLKRATEFSWDRLARQTCRVYETCLS